MTHIEKIKTSYHLSYFQRFVYGVVLPNIALVLLTAAYLYYAGYFAEFEKIAGPSGPGPGAGNGATLLAAVVVYLVGFVALTVFLFIPSLAVTIAISMRNWSSRAIAFLVGCAGCILVSLLYYGFMIYMLNSIRS